MHLIKKCPACARQLRFPIDRGTIRVRCRCGHEFTADPDEPSLYNDARFDLSRPSSGDKFYRQGIFRRLSGIKPGELKNDFINSLLKCKYDIQNFRLLPSGEKKKLLLRICVAAALLLTAWFLLASVCGSPVPENNIL